MKMKKNKTWYIKYQLKNDISIRYHYLWENNIKLQNKWIIKDHQNSIKEEISEALATRMIEDLCSEEPHEIMGSMINGKYMKRLITKDGKCKLIDDKKLEHLHSKRISKKHWKKREYGKYHMLNRVVKDWGYNVYESDGEYILSVIDINLKEEIYTGSYSYVKSKTSQLMSGAQALDYFPSENRIIKLNRIA